MNRLPRLFFPLLLLIITTSDIFAQDLVIAIRQSQQQGFTFIDEDGATLFKLPLGHDPTVRQKREPFKLSNYYTIDFSANVLPVRNGDNYYLINQKGEKIRDMGNNYNWI